MMYENERLIKFGSGELNSFKREIVDPVSGTKSVIEKFPLGLERISDNLPLEFHPQAGGRDIDNLYDLESAPPLLVEQKIGMFGEFNILFGGYPTVDSDPAEEEVGDESSVEVLVAGEDFILCSAFYTNGTGELNRIRIRADNYDHPKFGNNPNEVNFKNEGDLLIVGKKTTHGKAKMNTTVLDGNIIEVNFELPRINRLVKQAF